MDWQAVAAVLVLLACVALWVWPGEDDEVLWKSEDMKRWRRDWRTWWRL